MAKEVKEVSTFTQRMEDKLKAVKENVKKGMAEISMKDTMETAKKGAKDTYQGVKDAGAATVEALDTRNVVKKGSELFNKGSDIYEDLKKKKEKDATK